MASYFQLPVMNPVFPYPSLASEDCPQSLTAVLNKPPEEQQSKRREETNQMDSSSAILKAHLERTVGQQSTENEKTPCDTGGLISGRPSTAQSTGSQMSEKHPSPDTVSYSEPQHPTADDHNRTHGATDSSTVLLVKSGGDQEICHVIDADEDSTRDIGKCPTSIKKEPDILDVSNDFHPISPEELCREMRRASIAQHIMNAQMHNTLDASSTPRHRGSMEDPLIEDPDGLNPMEPASFLTNNDITCSGPDGEIDPLQVTDFRCKLCNYTGRSLHCLIKHYKAHNIAHKICKYCDKAFERPSDLTRHVLRHHKSEIEKLSATGQSREIDFNSDIATFTDYKKMKQSARAEENRDFFRCDRCKYSSKKMHELLHHRKKAHTSWFFCEVCGAKFISQLSLATHREQVHRLNDPLPNPVPYFDSVELSHKARQPTPTVSGPKPEVSETVFSCPLCASKKIIFPLKTLLFGHLRSKHKDPKGFIQCDKCRFKTKKSQRFLLHRRKAHTTWSCEVCGARYILADSLATHRSAVHGLTAPASQYNNSSDQIVSSFKPTEPQNMVYKRPAISDTIYSCSLCTSGRVEFRSRSSLVSHIRQNHVDADVYSQMNALQESKIDPSECSVLRVDTYSSGVLLKTALCHAQVGDDNSITLGLTEVTPQQVKGQDVPGVSAAEDAKQIMHKISTQAFCSSTVAIHSHDTSTKGTRKLLNTSSEPHHKPTGHDITPVDGHNTDTVSASSKATMRPSVSKPSTSSVPAILEKLGLTAVKSTPPLPVASTTVTMTQNQSKDSDGYVSGVPPPELASDYIVDPSELSFSVEQAVMNETTNGVNQQGHYSCPRCSYTTNIEEKYDAHLVAHRGKFICKLCSKAFIKTSDLTRHWLTHGKGTGNKYQCDTCDYCTPSRASLETHMKNHYSMMYAHRQVNKHVKCSACGQTFLRLEFWKHIKEVHGGMKGIRFKGKRHQKKHRLSKTEVFSSHMSYTDPASVLSGHEQPYAPLERSAESSSPDIDINHVPLIEISPEDYLSELVDDADTSPSDFSAEFLKVTKHDQTPMLSPSKRKRRRRNSRDDNDSPSLMCIYCDKSFSSVERLETHLNLHERNYASGGKRKKKVECPECHKIFCNAYYLADHMHLHTGETPHVCEFCGKGFSIPQCLSTHKSQGKCPKMPSGARTPEKKRQKRRKKKLNSWYRPRVRQARKQKRSSAFALSTSCPPPPNDDAAITPIIETETEDVIPANMDVPVDQGQTTDNAPNVDSANQAPGPGQDNLEI